MPRTFFTSTGQRVTTYYEPITIPMVFLAGEIHPMQARMNLRPDSKVSEA
jgi:hypothetical protein